MVQCIVLDLKVENMANEARQFLDTLNIKLPESYLRPSHKSGQLIIVNFYKYRL